MIHLNTAIRIKVEQLYVILLVSTFTGAKMWIFCMSIIFYYVIANKNKNKPISLLKYALNAYVCAFIVKQRVELELIQWNILSKKTTH